MNRSSFAPKMLKPKKCRMCSVVFVPQRSMQFACSPKCGQAWAEKLKAQKAAKALKAERKSMKERAEKIKTRAEHMRELQTAFNAFIRLRDANEPCISCERPASWRGQWDAGHYRSRGSEPSLAVEPLNTHKQCLPCNRHLSANLIPYRVNLIKKIGIERVEWLEGKHEPKKLTVTEIVEMKKLYRAKVREFKKEVANQLEESYV